MPGDAHGLRVRATRITPKRSGARREDANVEELNKCLKQTRQNPAARRERNTKLPAAEHGTTGYNVIQCNIIYYIV